MNRVSYIESIVGGVRVRIDLDNFRNLFDLFDNAIRFEDFVFDSNDYWSMVRRNVHIIVPKLSRTRKDLI